MSVGEGFRENAGASGTPSRAPFRRQWAANESPGAVTEPRHAQSQVSKGPAAEMRPPGNHPQCAGQCGSQRRRRVSEAAEETPRRLRAWGGWGVAEISPAPAE